MSDKLVDVTIHIDEELNIDQQNTIVEELRDCNGVIAVGHQKKVAHLFIIEYDPEVIDSEKLLSAVKQHGVHAELIGL